MRQLVWMGIAAGLMAGSGALAQSEVGTLKATYSAAEGIGADQGVMRRDPSDIIKVDDLYYVWYSKGKISPGYDANVWYATSPDGHTWTEKGMALDKGDAGTWEDASVFTPNILLAEDCYWLFYTGTSREFGKGFNPDSMIGIAVSDSPDGPWERLAMNPVLKNSDNPAGFDSHLIDDACLIVRDGKCWFTTGAGSWEKVRRKPSLGWPSRTYRRVLTQSMQTILIGFVERRIGSRTTGYTLMDLNMQHKTIISVLTAVLAAVLATSGATAQQTRSEERATRRAQRGKYLETGGERKLDVVYKNVSGKELKLDLYYPTAKRNEKCPVIVFTHGGGWAAGNREKAASGSFGLVFGQLVKEGFAVAPVTYRLAKEDSNVAIRDCVIDCKDAVRYLAKNSEALGIDPMRVFVMGDSAGGHIAQMLLLTSPGQLPGDPALAEVPYRMIAGVSWYGPCDFEKMDLFNHDDRADFRDRFTQRILGSNFGPQDKLARYREVSPINYLNKDSPPLLMIQGDKDTTIPVKHAYHMQQKAEAVKAPVEIMIIRNAGHNWRKVDAEIDPSREAIIERTVQFFVDHR